MARSGGCSPPSGVDEGRPAGENSPRSARGSADGGPSRSIRVNHVGIVCPNVPGHINPMIALADAIRTRGHRVTFFLLGEPSGSVAAGGFEVVPLGGSIFPA